MCIHCLRSNVCGCTVLHVCTVCSFYYANSCVNNKQVSLAEHQLDTENNKLTSRTILCLYSLACPFRCTTYYYQKTVYIVNFLVSCISPSNYVSRDSTENHVKSIRTANLLLLQTSRSFSPMHNSSQLSTTSTEVDSMTKSMTAFSVCPIISTLNW